MGHMGSYTWAHHGTSAIIPKYNIGLKFLYLFQEFENGSAIHTVKTWDFLFSARMRLSSIFGFVAPRFLRAQQSPGKEDQ